MHLFDKLFGLGAPIKAKAPEHAVVVKFDYIGSTDLQPLFDLEHLLEEALLAASAGELDGNEVAVDGSDGFLFMYGPDADRLFQVIKPVLGAERQCAPAALVGRFWAAPQLHR